MKCPIETQETSEVLLAYCGRRLDAERSAALERHMAICPACREFARGQEAVWEALETWDAEPVPLDFNRRLYHRIEEQEQSRWRRFWAAAPGAVVLRRGLPVAAAACILVIAGSIFEAPRKPLAAGGQVRVETVQADQVERALDDMELLQSLNQEVRAQVSDRM